MNFNRWNHSNINTVGTPSCEQPDNHYLIISVSLNGGLNIKTISPLVSVWQMTLNATLGPVLYLWTSTTLLILCVVIFVCSVLWRLDYEWLLTEGGNYWPESQTDSEPEPWLNQTGTSFALNSQKSTQQYVSVHEPLCINVLKDGSSLNMLMFLVNRELREQRWNKHCWLPWEMLKTL